MYSQWSRQNCMGGDWRLGSTKQYPVPKMTPCSVNVASVQWATAVFILKLLHVPVCSESPNCFLEGRRWKGSSLFYIYISVGSDRQSWLFCGLSEEMDLVSVKYHLVHMGFGFVLGRDRDDTSTVISDQESEKKSYLDGFLNMLQLIILGQSISF